MPRNRSLLVCVPDTNSLIHLRDVEISGRDARLWLWDEFEVRVGPTIPQEAARHHDLMRGQLKRKLERSVVPPAFDLDRIEQSFLAPLGISFETEDDLGERNNYSVALQLVVQNNARQIIFLTDELRVVRERGGFVKLLFDAYPIGMLWNSLDFLLYLYLRQRRFGYSEAESAVRTVNARIGGPQDQVANRLVTYTQHLQSIDFARRQLPTLWGR
jgi:hypothetical protein